MLRMSNEKHVRTAVREKRETSTARERIYHCQRWGHEERGSSPARERILKQTKYCDGVKKEIKYVAWCVRGEDPAQRSKASQRIEISDDQHAACQ